MPSTPNPASMFAAWNRVRQQLQRISSTSSEIHVTIVSYLYARKLPENVGKVDLCFVDEWARQRGTELLNGKIVSGSTPPLDFEHPQTGEICHRHCHYHSEQTVDEFLACISEAAKLLLQLPSSASDFLWKGSFVPRQTSGNPFAFWADAVLQLALRTVNTHPTTCSTKCYTWDVNAAREYEDEDEDEDANRIELWNEFIAGEMSESQVQRSPMRLPQPFWFWIAELDEFVAKSLTLVDWILRQYQPEGRKTFRTEKKRFSAVLAGCEDAMTKLLMMSHMIGHSLGKSSDRVNADFFTEYGGSIDELPERRLEIFEEMKQTARRHLEKCGWLPR